LTKIRLVEWFTVEGPEFKPQYFKKKKKDLKVEGELFRKRKGSSKRGKGDNIR
jgi:hypothetical protein